jgi:hypothetical protein
MAAEAYIGIGALIDFLKEPADVAYIGPKVPPLKRTDRGGATE